jgi:hypothetical protein
MGEESTRFWWESLKERVHVEDCKWEDGIRMQIVLPGGGGVRWWDVVNVKNLWVMVLQ